MEGTPVGGGEQQQGHGTNHSIIFSSRRMNTGRNVHTGKDWSRYKSSVQLCTLYCIIFTRFGYILLRSADSFLSSLYPYNTNLYTDHVVAHIQTSKPDTEPNSSAPILPCTPTRGIPAPFAIACPRRPDFYIYRTIFARPFVKNLDLKNSSATILLYTPRSSGTVATFRLRIRGMDRTFILATPGADELMHSVLFLQRITVCFLIPTGALALRSDMSSSRAAKPKSSISAKPSSSSGVMSLPWYLMVSDESSSVTLGVGMAS